MVLKNEKPLTDYIGKWLFVLFVLPLCAGAQDMAGTQASAPPGKLLATHPITINTTAGHRIEASFQAKEKNFFFRFSGTGPAAHTINTGDQAIFLLANDSTVTLQATSVQGYHDLDSVRSFSHEYTLPQADLEMLSRNTVRAIRKYSVMGFDEFYLDETAAANLRSQGNYFLQVLDKEKLLKKIVLTEPAFPGGRQVMLAFINNNLKQLPVLPGGEQKAVTVQFQVLADGSVQQIQVSQSAGAVFDSELLRILKRMPRWKPALADGDPIPRIVVQQVKFYQDADKVKVSF